MWDIEDNLRKIINEGDNAKMEKLSDILEEVIERLDEEDYKKYAKCIYIMANGYVLTPEMAEKIVSKMKPYGKHWTMEETTSVKNNHSLSRISDIDFFVVMNSKYNDNKSTVDKYAETDEEKLEMYVDLSKDFILDPDAKEDKIFNYYM